MCRVKVAKRHIQVTKANEKSGFFTDKHFPREEQLSWVLFESFR